MKSIVHVDEYIFV